MTNLPVELSGTKIEESQLLKREDDQTSRLKITIIETVYIQYILRVVVYTLACTRCRISNHIGRLFKQPPPYRCSCRLAHKIEPSRVRSLILITQQRRKEAKRNEKWEIRSRFLFTWIMRTQGSPHLVRSEQRLNIQTAPASYNTYSSRPNVYRSRRRWYCSGSTGRRAPCGHRNHSHKKTRAGRRTQAICLWSGKSIF